MLVSKLYEIEYEYLVDREYKPGFYYSFMKDCNNNWVVPEEEVNETTNPFTIWIKDCPVIEYCVPNGI